MNKTPFVVSGIDNKSAASRVYRKGYGGSYLVLE